MNPARRRSGPPADCRVRIDATLRELPSAKRKLTGRDWRGARDASDDDVPARTYAYAVIARLGMFRPYRLLRERAGELPDAPVFDRRAAYLIADMLADNGARAASFGLESFLAFDFPVACKTGTSSNYRDNWAFAFTPELAVLFIDLNLSNTSHSS